MSTYQEMKALAGLLGADRAQRRKRLERLRERAAKLTLEELRAEFWRLQDMSNAMPQDEYEGPKGERLAQEQEPLAALLEEALGSNWMFEADARGPNNTQNLSDLGRKGLD